MVSSLSSASLVYTIYFLKHFVGFDTSCPVTHYLSFISPELTELEQHSAWLEDIRLNIWDRIKFENNMIPSDDSLHLHSMRTCWILHMWRQANSNTMNLKPMTEYGWVVEDNNARTIWDSQIFFQSIRERVHVLLRGCKCITGCTTGRCSCRRKEKMWRRMSVLELHQH